LSDFTELKKYVKLERKSALYMSLELFLIFKTDFLLPLKLTVLEIDKKVMAAYKS